MNRSQSNQSGLSLIVVIVIASVFILTTTGVYLVFSNYKSKQIEKEKQTKELIEKQQKVLEETKKELESVKKETQQEIKALKRVQVPTSKDLPSIIREWEPRVAFILCEWDFVDTGQPYLVKSGSGLLVRTESGFTVVTNKHVLQDNFGYGPNTCLVQMPGSPTYAVYNQNTTILPTYDVGYVTLTADDYLISLLKTRAEVCRPPSATLGEKIVILGYPTGGSASTVTVTPGVISGYDGDYYVTDAKIEYGSSGGVAILTKDDCYLGIPTGAVVGGIESFARILRSDVALQPTK